MTLWEALSQKLDISRDMFIERWGEYIECEKELEFRRTFNCGFSVFTNYNENFYTAEKIHSSLDSRVDFIVTPEDGTKYHIDLEVVLIIDKTYLKPFQCQATDNCPYKVNMTFKLYMIKISSES